VVCGIGRNPSISGSCRAASWSSPNDGHCIAARTMPVMSVAVATMSAACGVKSAVTSMRVDRGRTPTPLDAGLVASTITGHGRM
jgi:hypothetical protein